MSRLGNYLFQLIIAGLLIITSFAMTSTVIAAPDEGLDESMENPGYHKKPEWFKQSFLDLNEDIKEATAEKKRLVVFFYQDGCPYCKKLLEDNFGQKAIAEKMQKHFDLVAINMWGDREVTYRRDTFTEKSFAETASVMYTPTILFFDEKGSVVFRMNGYYNPEKFNVVLDYVSQKLERRVKFMDYLADHRPLRAKGRIHDDIETIDRPYQFETAVKTGKPLLVMFEQKQCKPCDELHLDVLKRKESLTLLRNFNIAVLDIWSDDTLIKPNGRRSKANLWAKDLGVTYAPTMVFFNSKGKEVFRIDAYLKSFHIQSVLDYVQQKAYLKQPNFQRWIDARAHKLEEKGFTIDLMK